jgi:hypothetical protein
VFSGWTSAHQYDWFFRLCSWLAAQTVAGLMGDFGYKSETRTEPDVLDILCGDADDGTAGTTSVRPPAGDGSREVIEMVESCDKELGSDNKLRLVELFTNLMSVLWSMPEADLMNNSKPCCRLRGILERCLKEVTEETSWFRCKDQRELVHMAISLLRFIVERFGSVNDEFPNDLLASLVETLRTAHDVNSRPDILTMVKVIFGHASKSRTWMETVVKDYASGLVDLIQTHADQCSVTDCIGALIKSSSRSSIRWEEPSTGSSDEVTVEESLMDTARRLIDFDASDVACLRHIFELWHISFLCDVVAFFPQLSGRIGDSTFFLRVFEYMRPESYPFFPFRLVTGIIRHTTGADRAKIVPLVTPEMIKGMVGLPKAREEERIEFWAFCTECLLCEIQDVESVMATGVFDEIMGFLRDGDCYSYLYVPAVKVIEAAIWAGKSSVVGTFFEGGVFPFVLRMLDFYVGEELVHLLEEMAKIWQAICADENNRCRFVEMFEAGGGFGAFEFLFSAAWASVWALVSEVAMEIFLELPSLHLHAFVALEHRLESSLECLAFS